jgi:phenylacetate-coenzyme A ligase PaaK-like adenylate-forming protein
MSFDGTFSHLKDVEALQKELKAKPESHWTKRGEDMALNLFQQMSRRVPAYKDFLAKNGFDPAGVKTIGDFKRVPLIDKDNYLREYPLEQLCWDGDFAHNRWVISTTSGSTGEPFYFPRTDLQDELYAITAELYLRENFKIHERTTLYVNAFAMGAWIGGVFTYEAIHRVALKGYDLSTITPGINKAEVINSVRELGPNFDQVIIGCYPPVLKDIIDLGIKEGLDWEDYNLGIVFSAEGFSEEFRDYVADHGKLADIHKSTLNHYGTVDLGTMSHETPLSILLRRQGLKDEPLFNDLFQGVTKQPTVTQFLPEMFYFESDSGQLICSAYGGLPLVRYDLKDRGGVLCLSEAERIYQDHGKDLRAELKTAGLSDTAWNLPLVYLYERSDLSVTFIGAQIYPEEIKRVLLRKEFSDRLTGKLTMEVATDDKMRSRLIIHAELKDGVEASELPAEPLEDAITGKLCQDNSEYASNYATYGDEIRPKVKLWPYEHPLHFSGKGKQKWVKK